VHSPKTNVIILPDNSFVYIASFVYRKMVDTSKISSFYTALANHHFIILRINSLMKEVLQQFKQNYLIKYWNPVAAVIAAGLISAYYFGVTGTYWAVTGEFTRWGGHALQALGVDVSDWSYYKIIGMQGTIFTRIDGVMILGMFAGCISAALWANNVKWRNQPHKRRIVQALIGGALAGFGARLAMGCNLASLFTGIPQFSVHACFGSVSCNFAAPFFNSNFTRNIGSKVTFTPA
jgi:uncharacterized protein